VRATTRSVMHVPANMSNMFSRVQKHIDDAGAQDPQQVLELRWDTSPWESEHLFAISAPVPDEEMTSLSGDYITRVFEDPYRRAKAWEKEMREIAGASSREPARIFFFYTTCPNCAKAYGKNYVVGVAGR
jgi:hydrolase family protein